jgi:hypothetical protein
MVLRRCLTSSLLLLLACSDGTFRSESISLIAGDSLDFPDPGEPSLQLRCEQGRLAAYLVVGVPPERETGALADRGVQVELDSAPACSDSAPEGAISY